MASKSQIKANRKNASRSTGPKTEQGKAASARNATRHGLSSAGITVLPTEDPADLDALAQSLRDEHKPQGDTENFLVHQMIQSRWKLARIERLEHDAFEQLMESDFNDRGIDRRIVGTLSSKGNTLDSLQRYAATAERCYYKALKELQNLRSRKNSRKEQNEAESAQATLRDLLASTPFPGGNSWKNGDLGISQNEPDVDDTLVPMPGQNGPRNLRS